MALTLQDVSAFDPSFFVSCEGSVCVVLIIVPWIQHLNINFGEPVPEHYVVAYIMRLDATCCVCYCSDARPTQPVPVVVAYDTAHDEACRTKCADVSACGKAGGHFADAFSSACA